MTFNHLPDLGFEHARRKAVEAGYRVQETGGSMPKWIESPDFWGGCQVQVEFGPPLGEEVDPPYDVIVKQRRSSAITNWQIVSIEKRPRAK